MPRGCRAMQNAARRPRSRVLPSARDDYFAAATM